MFLMAEAVDWVQRDEEGFDPIRQAAVMSLVLEAPRRAD